MTFSSGTSGGGINFAACVARNFHRKGAEEAREREVKGPHQTRLTLRPAITFSAARMSHRQRHAKDHEVEAKEHKLASGVRVARVDELGQEGHEEQHDLRVGEIDADAEQEGLRHGSARRAAAHVERGAAADASTASHSK